MKCTIIFTVLLLLASIEVLNASEPQEFQLWDSKRAVPKVAELESLDNVRFSVIKPYEFSTDGYRFLHGVALCFHNNRLYASFGHNQGGENTSSEQARWCVSDDLGLSWSRVETMDAGTEENLGISHGAFLSHDGQLWAFMGAYRGTMKDVHTRAYTFEESTQQWQPKGVVIKQGFWPMQQPVRLVNGNWMMAGLKVGHGNPAVVALSEGDDFTKWKVVTIPRADQSKMWGESAVIVSGNRVLNISRYGAQAKALFSISEDSGKNWSLMKPGNLPMTTSKPCAGRLSNGQNYLICTTTADSGGRRSPLTIAVTSAGEFTFRKIFLIRRSLFPEGPGESHPKAKLSYPYAVEHKGKLYVGYSNDGGKVGRVGTGRELWNNNSAELAVIPIEELHIE